MLESQQWLAVRRRHGEARTVLVRTSDGVTTEADLHLRPPKAPCGAPRLNFYVKVPCLGRSVCPARSGGGFKQTSSAAAAVQNVAAEGAGCSLPSPVQSHTLQWRSQDSRESFSISQQVK